MVEEEGESNSQISSQTRAVENTDFTDWADLDDFVINPKNLMPCSSWQIAFKLEKKDCYLCDLW